MQCIKCRAPLPDGAVFCPACGKKQAPEKRKALKRANGTGTVYKLSGRRRRPWVAAKNKVVLGYYETKTAALETLERVSGREISQRYNMTFAQVYDAWSAEHYRTLTESGITSYNRAYDVFAALHGRKFRDLRTEDFQRVIDGHMEKTHSTVSKYKQLITQMSQWAIREELLTTNFATFVQLPENVKREKEIFADADIAKLETDGSETARIVLMLIYTGMRIGELFTLSVDDYHGEYVIGGEKTEAGRNRIIPIRPEGKEYFAYFAHCATGPQLLSGYSGQRIPNNFRKRDYYPLLERLGIRKLNPHCTRHTFTSWAVSAGIPPEILQRILGHADYSTTVNNYTHFDIEQIINSVSNASATKKDCKDLL